VTRRTDTRPTALRGRLVERFRAGPRRVLSIYVPSLLADAGTGDRH
jgi:hypothetical protein